MQALCGLQGIFDLFNCKTPGQVVLYNTLRENASPFFHFFLFSGRKIVKYPGYL